jgi:nitrite reductase/ring-hydroxylating ferredoxin subunit
MTDDGSARSCPGVSRRGVFRLFCAAGAGAAGCGRAGGGQPTGPIAAGKVQDLPVGTFRVMGDVVVARDSGGLYAMSAVCTHAGCPTRESNGQLFCPCHGSLFDRNGNVTRGPARQALPHFQVEVGPDGSLTVQASTVVAADARFQPPHDDP